MDHWRSFLCLADLVADGDHRLGMVGRYGCLEWGSIVDVGVFDGSIVDAYVDDSADHFGHFGQWFSEHVDDYYSIYSHNFG